MRLYFEILKLLGRKIILRQNTGLVLRKFCEKMGLAYIKFAQILAMQNFGKIFTEEDRQMLLGICDDCRPVEFARIEEVLRAEYGERLEEIFAEIESEPVGAASVSQVHRARLVSGEEVVVKVRRKDVAKHVERDVAKMRKLVHRYGRWFGFRNFVGGDRALELYLEWIREEVDFRHEQQNMRQYREFTEKVNGKVAGTKRIETPKLYDELCTDEVIVMEYIAAPTINRMELTEENKAKINTGINDYVRSSFWALLHDETVVFHGDPHGGNIYIREDGSLGFLDMGLIFVLSTEEQELLKRFFLAAYARKSEKIYEMLIPYAEMAEKDKTKFREDVEKYCEAVAKKNVTAYFIDMMAICLKYQFLPPNFLFCMAKAFVCLGGIAGFAENMTTIEKLLGEQVAEFLVRRSLRDCEAIMTDGMRCLPEMVVAMLEGGAAQGIGMGMLKAKELRGKVREAWENFDEALELMAI